MHHKSIYQKPNGQYFLARNDDVTREAYEQMGCRITDKTGGVALVMTPHIETETEIMAEYLKHFPLISQGSGANLSGAVVMTLPDEAKRIIELMQDLDFWSGTASELVNEIGTGKVNKLFQVGVLDVLNEAGIKVVKKRSADKRLIEISKVNR